jgi:hypothetical protein
MEKIILGIFNPLHGREDNMCLLKDQKHVLDAFSL